MLPGDLQQLINQTGAIVFDNPEHILKPVYRKEIYRCIANQHQSENFRQRLELLTAYYVLPIWQETWPRNLLPELTLNMAHQFLEGRINQATLQQTINAFGYILEDLGTNLAEQFYRAASAGEAALEAASRVTGYERWTDQWPIIDESLTDEWLDAQYSDTAKWASFAYAGRAIDPDSDPAKRLDFWRWWLFETIPSAHKSL